MPIVLCRQCKTPFPAKPSWIQKGHGIYCSAACHHKSSQKGEIIPCYICGEKTYKKLKDLNRSKSGRFFCGKSCQTKWRNSTFIQEKHPNWKEGRYAYRSVLTRGKISPKCTLCKIADKRTLAVHHIDENRKNNNIENLAWLCHNCHHLVHHYSVERAKFMAAMV